MKKTVYAWKPGAIINGVSAQVAGEEVAALQAKNGNMLFTKKALVEAAKPKDAPLHAAFTWDNEVCGELHRLEEARKIIQSIVVIETAETKPAAAIRAFVSVRNDNDEPNYTTTAYAFSNDEYREQILAQARRDMLAFERKYAQFIDLSNVRREFDRATLAEAEQPVDLAS